MKTKALTIDKETVTFCITESGNIYVMNRENNNYRQIGNENDERLDPTILNELLKASRTLNQPGGYHFNVTKDILECYRKILDCASYTEDAITQLGEDYKVVLAPKGKVTINLDEDIFEVAKDLMCTLSLKANKRGIITNAVFRNLDNATFTTICIEITELAVNSMRQSSDEFVKKLGDTLFIRYMDPAFANYDIEKCCEKIGIPVPTFKRYIREGIENLSIRLFGFFPGDRSPLKLNYDDTL